MTAPAPLPEDGAFEAPPARRPSRRGEPSRRQGRGGSARSRASGRGDVPRGYQQRAGHATPQARPAAAQGRSNAARRAYARRAERADRAERIRGTRGKRPFPAPTAVFSSRATFVVVVMSLLAVGVVATLWLSTQATAGTYRLENVKQDVAALNAKVARLRSDVARASSPASLAAKARRMGMVSAGVPAHLVVGKDGSVTVVGTPSEVTPTDTPPPKDPAGPRMPAGPAGSGGQGQGGHQQAAPDPQGGGH